MSETKPKPVPPYSIRDEADLAWYHGQGQTNFERSTMGGMLERQESLAVERRWPTVPVLSGENVIGYECGITAWPTAETREISGYTPDLAALTRYADVSKLMLLVERRSRLAATVIALYFGELGNRWAQGETGHGRAGSLYHLTAKGQALVTAASKAPGSIQLTAPERIESLAIVNKAKPTEERSQALAVCVRQAERLEVEARAVWHGVKAEI